MSADIAILIWSGVGKHNWIHPAKWLLQVQIISTAHSSTFELVISWQLIARLSLPLELLPGNRGKNPHDSYQAWQVFGFFSLRVGVTLLTWVAFICSASIPCLSGNCIPLLLLWITIHYSLFIPWVRLTLPLSCRGGFVRAKLMRLIFEGNSRLKERRKEGKKLIQLPATWEDRGFLS